MLHAVTPLTICGAFVFGIVLALIGSLKLTLMRKLELRETHVGALLSVLNLSLLPMMLIAGILLDDFGARIVMLIGSLGTAMGLYFAGMSKSLSQTAASILVVGAGSAFLSVGSVVLMESAFYPGQITASQNLGNVFFGLGALLTPPLLETLLERFSYRRALTVLACVGLIPGIMALITASAAFPVHYSSGHVADVVRSKVVVLTGIVLLIYLPLEWILGAWSTTFLMGLGMGERRAVFTLSAFWLSFLASRFVTAMLMASGWIAPGVADAWLIIVLALGAGVTLGNMAGARNGKGAAIGLILTGALLGPIFPTLVGILFSFVDPQQVGTAYGAMFSIGSLGGLLLSPVMGAYAGQRGMRTAWRVPIILALFISLVGIGLFTEWGF
ncbi:MAG TPA: MFS transporter [Gemmataceae bacterium]|jgi:fucose permease|nr:MFS transporter [Gemmataceae bacterium]